MLTSPASASVVEGPDRAQREPKKKTQGLIPRERIEQRIFLLRGERVMLSTDLARLYEVEVKAKRNVGDCDLRSLRALAEEGKLKPYLCVALEPRRRTVGNIIILPFEEFLGELWGGRYR